MSKVETKTGKGSEELKEKIQEAQEIANAVLNGEGSDGQGNGLGEEDPGDEERRRQEFKPIDQARNKFTKIPAYKDIIYKIVPHYVNEKGIEVSSKDIHMGVYFNAKKITVRSINGTENSRGNVVVINGDVEIPELQKDYDNLSMTEKIYLTEESLNTAWENLNRSQMILAKERKEAYEKLEKLISKNITENFKFE